MLSACPSKIRSLRESSKVDRFFQSGEKSGCVIPSLVNQPDWVVSLPFAWRPSRISSAASRRSPACLWYHPRTVFRAKETVPAGA